MTVVNNSVYENREGDSFKVINVSSENDVSIQFIETGYACRARQHLVSSGNVRDYTALETERESWVVYEREFVSNSGDKFQSFSRNGDRILVEFLETGSVVNVNLYNARAGKVKDPLKRTVYGEGYIGFPDKTLPYWRQASQLWKNMLKRCYSKKDSRGYYGRCFVDERWKCFENFLNDIKYLEGFDEWLKGGDDPYYSSNLDKDFYKKGNSVYSRHYCRFLPEGYNKSLGKKGKTVKDWV